MFDGAEIYIAIKVFGKLFFGGESDWEDFDIDWRPFDEEEKVFIKTQK